MVVPQRLSGTHRTLLSSLTEIEILEHSPAVSRSVVELNLPPGTLLTLLSRGREQIIPRGSTVLMPGDRLLVRANDRDIEIVRFALVGKEDHS